MPVGNRESLFGSSDDCLAALMAAVDRKGRALVGVTVLSGKIGGNSTRETESRANGMAESDQAEQSGDEVDYSATSALRLMIHSSSSAKKNKNKRMRSRNRVIDDWLGDEAGDDAYADLEDFIV